MWKNKKMNKNENSAHVIQRVPEEMRLEKSAGMELESGKKSRSLSK